MRMDLVRPLMPVVLIIDEKVTWAVEEWGLKSKSNNTPFEDRLMQGRVVRTVVAGQTAFELET